MSGVLGLVGVLPVEVADFGRCASEVAVKFSSVVLQAVAFPTYKVVESAVDEL